MSTNRHDAPREPSGLLNNAKYTTINGGHFVYNNLPDDPNKYLDLFFKRVAVNAILNAGGRADPVQCFPGTREEVLARIHRWRTEGYRDDRRPFWLSGPAGAGKSAIVQTVAEDCLALDIPIASFFIFRSDPTRNRAHPIAATAAYQLFDFDPSLKDRIEAVIRNDPLTFNKSIRDQFTALLDTPVRQSASIMQPGRPIVLLIDGLDECEPKDDQAVILDVLYNLVTAPNSPFIALVASRTEHQITSSFNRLGSSPDSIFLDDTFRPDVDIRRYLEAQFQDIKRSHTLRQLLAPEWPSDDAITHLVAKSSGQFIYAATVARFVSASPASPKESLAQMISLTSMGNNRPFAPLDALYMHILSQAHNVNSVLDILAAQIISRTITLATQTMLATLGYSSEVIISRLSHLSALVKIAYRGNDDDDNILAFYHASFSDFLVDEARSKGYYPDFSTMASRIILQCVTGTTFPRGFLLMLKTYKQWVKKHNVYLDDALINWDPHKIYWEDRDAQIDAAFLDKLDVLYQEADPVLRRYLFERWAVIVITIQHGIGHHEKKLSRRTRLHLKVEGWLRKWNNDRWAWYALRALDRRYEHLRLQHSVE